ncbi:RNase adapter RapZ [Spongiibacter sp. KMU-158]|uniref:RNase adapter RapZ n=1 Tax=Spongiibacter pelagi TaxID=2760804 RepID=A0A927C4P5_9GAMM|nr:RNase adapter RapZ [Spongiibacter pelagi]MBD2859701.1 RNase adapter RapZ [Spongiibacter pelagi]
MKLIILSGRSGAGKSTALNQLEDEGYYAIDNLPVSLLPALVSELSRSKLKVHKRVAVCIDARNSATELNQFSGMLESLKKSAELKIIFLDANDNELIKRFSETRRRHPLSNNSLPLSDAIRLEQQLLDPIAAEAAFVIDSSSMTVHELRDVIRDRLMGQDGNSLAVQLKSFGFKRGLPIDADQVFDLRMLPNPHWEPSLRKLDGRDPAIQDFLSDHPMVEAMHGDILHFLQQWIPKIEGSNRSYFTVAIGCTGGQHRSVYMVERLAKSLAETVPQLQVRHREL